MNNGISLLKIITGLSKTLNIANQLLPIYKQVKPLISTYTNSLKKLPLNNQTRNNTKQINTSTTEHTQDITTSSNNKPTFFQ